MFLSFIILVTLIISVNAAETPTFNFTLQNEPVSSGDRTKAVIIDAGADVTASTINIADFTVSAHNTYIQNGRVNVYFDGNRPIRNAYVAQDNKLGAASKSTGRYIILELDWDVGTGANGENDGAKTCTPSYALALNYSIQLVGSFSYTSAQIVDSANFTQAGIVDPIIEKFQSGTYQGIPYRVYFNDAVSGPLPLVLYFHGGGQGNDNDCHVKFMNGATTWAYPTNQAKYPCHIVAPVDVTTKPKMDSMVSLITQWIAEGKVDPDRIYVTGYSMGGSSTWDFIRYYPNLAAAAVPICVGGLKSVAEAQSLSKLPIWDFVCKEDFSYSGYIASSKTYAPYLKNYKLSILEENYCQSQNYGNGYCWPGHAEWEPAYSGDYVETTGRGKVIDWLFAQKKQSSPTLTFDLIQKSFPYDERNIGVIVDAGKDVDPASISAAAFSVRAHNTYMSGTTERVGYDGTRQIAKVYVNNNPEITSTPSNSGRYIVIELQHACTTTTDSTVTDATYGGGTIAFKQQYTVTQNSDIKYTDLTTVSPGAVAYRQALIKSEIIDQFVYGTWGTTKYRLFSPADKSKKQPLLIMFHGGGQGGDNEVHLRFHNPGPVWAYPENQAKYPCYVLCPSASSWTTKSLQDTKAYADRMIATGKVDPNRVYVTGYSMGGGAVWNFVRAFPDFPAAIGPLTPASGLTSVAEANAVVYLPTWSFISQGDPYCWTTTMNNHNNYGLKYLKDYRLTILPESSLIVDGVKYVWNPHACWLPTYNGQYDENLNDPNNGTLQDWLFSKSKIISVPVVAVETMAGIRPTMPGTVTVVCRHSSTGAVTEARSVAWNNIDPQNYAQTGPGAFTVEGTVEGCVEKAVANVTVYRAPLLNSLSNYIIDAGKLLSLTLSATDPNGDNLFYSATNLPAGAKLDPVTGKFSWTPELSQAGTYTVQFMVSNTHQLTDSKTATIVVNHINHQPVLAAIPNYSVTAGESLTFNVSANDLDGDSLSYSAANLPDGASFNPAIATFSWISVVSGSYTVKFTVSDGLLTDSKTMTITAYPGSNRPPVMSAIPSYIVKAGKLVSFTVKATDPDNDPLIYAVSNLPAGANFNSATQKFSWTPAAAGTYTVQFTVRDGELSDSKTAIIIVQ